MAAGFPDLLLWRARTPLTPGADEAATVVWSAKFVEVRQCLCLAFPLLP